MPEINFVKPRYKAIKVTQGENLMKALLEASVPVASSCHGDGVCAKCKVRIVSGGANLNFANETEAFLKEKNEIPVDYRISCQVSIYGDITVDTNYW